METGGTDTRALVVGDKVVAAMKRQAKAGENRSNTHSGGTPLPAMLSMEASKLAVSTAKALKADICGVDILEGPLGPVVIEANISPGLQGISQVATIDVADAIARYLFRRTEEIVKGRLQEGAAEVMKDLEIKSVDPDAMQEIVTSLQFRGERVLLPHIISKIAKLNNQKDYTIKAKKGKIEIEEF